MNIQKIFHDHKSLSRYEIDRRVSALLEATKLNQIEFNILHSVYESIGINPNNKNVLSALINRQLLCNVVEKTGARIMLSEYGGMVYHIANNWFNHKETIE